MFRHIVQFELKYRFKRVSTYVYFLLWFFIALLSMSVRQFGPGSSGGKVFLNSPFAITQMTAVLVAFGVVVVSGIVGTAVYRDFEEDTYQLFFTTRLRKRDYLGGRLVGSLLTVLIVFSGLIMGMLMGPLMPWADQARLMPTDLWFHVQPFLLFAATEAIFTGAIFFTVGALTRNIVFVYLQGVVFLAIYLVGIALVARNPDNLNASWPGLVDPFGIMTLAKVTRYWTVAEKNTMLVPLSDLMLQNRLFWLGIAAVFVIALFRFFPFSVEALTARRRPRSGRLLEVLPKAASIPPWIPRFRPRFAQRTIVAQFASLTRLRLLSIVKDVPFAALVLIGMVVVVINGLQAGRVLDTPVYPVTYLMADSIKGGLGLFLIVIITLYAGELVWKERGLKYDQIHDALPMPGWLNFTSQWTALFIVQAFLLVLLIGCGVGLQAAQGYYRFQLPVYVKELVLIVLPILAQFSVLALFLQTMVSNKFLAHALVIGFFIGEEVVGRYGFEDNLYLFANLPDYTYSDMNGYGHFVRTIIWFTLYWSACAAVLGTLSVLFNERGTDSQWRARLRNAGRLVRLPIGAIGAGALLAFAATGSYVFYNTHRLNAYESSATIRIKRAEYEKRYKKFEGIPQPRITAVDLKVDIFPERRSFSSTGTFTLVNKSDRPISDVHVVDAMGSLKRVAFDRGFKPTLADAAFGYYVYALDPPLKPNEPLRMEFAVGWDSKGFRSSHERSELAFNGTFFGRDYFPLIGYQREGELTDDDERRDQGLGPLPDLPSPQDPEAQLVNLFSADAGWINFTCTVSTSPDQIAIAPGYLQREWTEGGRRHFAYDMGETRIANFYSFISGRYEVRRDRWNDIGIEVYYDRQHPFNIDRMVEATKKGLAYLTRWFGPYQFKQFRILEFPRYASFAQSFPNTVPYSEGIGFIAHPRRRDDLDVPFYVTAHELAHQWWGHQVVGAYAQGSNVLSETLAQYSALMIMQKEVGPQNIRRYLKHELDRYLRGRSRERRREMPLARVQNEPYVWYQKGSLAMYALADYLGEERLNRALRTFLDRARFTEAPYTTAIELVAALRAVTPPDLQHVITDLFETITLFDVRATDATWHPAADGKYIVTL